jgi:putative transposase
MTDAAIAAMAPRIGTRAACKAAGVPQASWYRRHRASPAPPRPAPAPHRDRAQPRALDPAERQAILDMLHSERFADIAPAEAWAVLLDEGTYLGSVSTFYRLLREAGETRERRAQAVHPAAVKPELVATGPNQVYSWAWGPCGGSANAPLSRAAARRRRGEAQARPVGAHPRGSAGAPG